ncbi:MAG: hypothetical protein ACREI3_04260 [Nitrospirales bacterium]
MFRFLATLVMITTVFGVGYYIGQRPIGELHQTITTLKHTVASLTRNFLDSTLGLEENFRVRQALVDAKGNLVEAKADLLDRNFGNAAKEVASAVHHLERAAKASQDSGRGEQHASLEGLIAQAKAAQLDLTHGRDDTRRRLDQILSRVDRMLEG